MTTPPLKPLPPRTPPKPNLTFTDGLNFGCGFFVAGGAILFVLYSVLLFIARALFDLL